MKGFSTWLEICRGGKHRDSKGNLRDTTTLIDKAVANFNLETHEPPIVVGHPKDNSPAFGWVSGLRAVEKNGAKVLEAQFSQVNPEFADLVEKGTYKKRSASFYPDGTLKHVGFLGGNPPAIKGLKNIEFTGDDEAITIEFSEPTNTGGKAMSFKDKLKMAFNKAVDDMPDEGQPTSGGANFSEADLEAARKEAADKAAKEAREQAAAEFAEKEAQARKDAQKKGVAEFVEAGIKEGRIPPAWKDAGLQEFMEHLDCEGTIEFAEGQPEKTPAEWFQGFLADLPKVVDFSEIATKGKDPGDNGDDDKLVALAKARAKEDGCSFSEAVVLVSKENPGLAG